MREDPTSINNSTSNQGCPFEIAANAADGGASSQSSEAPPFGSQISNVQTWARECARLFPESDLDALSLVSESTSEHKVYYRERDVRAVKVTHAGFYGQIPCVTNGRLDRRNATPAEYLRRMALHNAVFDSDLKLEGVIVSDKPSMILFQPAGEPSFVISQPWYVRDGEATNEDIHDFLTGEGFHAIPGTYWGWFRPSDRVAIVDAKPDNLILTAAGIVALDLQMSILTEHEVLIANLPSGTELCSLYIPRGLEESSKIILG